MRTRKPFVPKDAYFALLVGKFILEMTHYDVGTYVLVNLVPSCWSFPFRLHSMYKILHESFISSNSIRGLPRVEPGLFPVTKY